MTTYNLGTVVGANGTDGRGIRCIQKTSTTGNIDTYTIYYTDETTTTFEVTNGEETDIVTAWETTLSDTKVPSEKLTKNTLDTKQATLVSGTNIKTINNNSLLGSGNIDIQGGSIDIVTSWETTLSDTKVPSEKLTKNTIDTKVDKVTGKGLSTEDYTSSEKSKLAGIETGANNYTHPTSKQCNYAPDLSNYVQKSSTTGLLKNDGTVMTSGTGSTNYSAGNHTHSGYVSATKVTSWSSTVSDSNVPSEKLVKDTIDALEDLIGDAIDYINL